MRPGFHMSYILPGLGPKARRRLKLVWIIGAWDLDIVCYLLFDAWNFFNSRTQLYLHIQYDLFSIFVRHDTR